MVMGNLRTSGRVITFLSPIDDNQASESSHITVLQHEDKETTRETVIGGGNDTIPTIVILNTTSDTSDC